MACHVEWDVRGLNSSQKEPNEFPKQTPELTRFDPPTHTPRPVTPCLRVI